MDCYICCCDLFDYRVTRDSRGHSDHCPDSHRENTPINQSSWTQYTMSSFMEIFRMYGPQLVYVASCGAPGINLENFTNTGDNLDHKASIGLRIVNEWHWGSAPQQTKARYNERIRKARGKPTPPSNAVRVSQLLAGTGGSASTTTATTRIMQSGIIQEYKIAFENEMKENEILESLKNIKIVIQSNPLSDRCFGYLWYSGHFESALALYELYDPRLGGDAVTDYIQTLRAVLESLSEISKVYKDLIREYELKMACKNANMVQQVENQNIIEAESSTNKEILSMDEPLVEEPMETPALPDHEADRCRISVNSFGMNLFNLRMQLSTMVKFPDSWCGSTLMTLYTIMDSVKLETRNIIKHRASLAQMRKWCDEYKPES